MLCPQCEDYVVSLVTKYEILNTHTGHGHSISVQHAICEGCIKELFVEITQKEKHKKKTT
jgi:hypothetical protein